MSRARFDGDDDTLINALAILRPTDIIYKEDAAAPVDQKALFKQKTRVIRLHKLQANLAFRRKQIDRVLVTLCAKNPQWGYTEELKKEFVQVVGDRISAMCQHVGRALGRKQIAQWAIQLTTHDEGTKTDCEILDETSTPATTLLDTPTSPNQAFFYGWDGECERAWRCDAAGGQSTPRQYTKELEPNPKGDMFPAIAVFSDGDRAEVSSLLTAAIPKTKLATRCSTQTPVPTVEEKQKKTKKTKRKVESSIQKYWEQEFDGQMLAIKDRTEGPYRPPILTVYYRSRQVMQVNYASGKIDKQQAIKIARQVACSSLKRFQTCVCVCVTLARASTTSAFGGPYARQAGDIKTD